MFPNYHFYIEAIATRNLFIAFLAVVAATALIGCWTVNHYLPNRFSLKAWIGVGVYYASLAGVVVLILNSH